MDDTLRAHYVAILINKKTVLILVLMDDTLRGNMLFSCATSLVLILVLMDDTLRESKLSLFR